MGISDEVFVTAWEETRAALESYARKSLGDRAEAEDAVAAACARVLRKLREQELGNIRPYLWRAVTNELRGRHRKRKSETDAYTRWDQVVAEAGADACTEGLVVWETVRSLPLRTQEVVLLRYQARLTELEIAEVLGLSPGTVKARLSRARDALKPLLREVYFDG